MTSKIQSALNTILNELTGLPLPKRIESLNHIRLALHSVSPFLSEPVDCVLWLPNSSIRANDYNPNTVAPPEMQLLQVSVRNDGYTQPIVSMPLTKPANGGIDIDGITHEVIDGFHRTRVGKECSDIKKRIHGYLPITQIRSDRYERSDRIAATIRHNRARGKHGVESMSDIVIELKRRNWTDDKISRELGMDQDEILRLCQISGLAELFSNREFSRSWDVDALRNNEEPAELLQNGTDE